MHCLMLLYIYSCIFYISSFIKKKIREKQQTNNKLILDVEHNILSYYVYQHIPKL